MPLYGKFLADRISAVSKPTTNESDVVLISKQSGGNILSRISNFISYRENLSGRSR